jgi:hypothetical protein
VRHSALPNSPWSTRNFVVELNLDESILQTSGRDSTGDRSFKSNGVKSP